MAYGRSPEEQARADRVAGLMMAVLTLIALFVSAVVAFGDGSGHHDFALACLPLAGASIVAVGGVRSYRRGVKTLRSMSHTGG